jgi:CubicO group peptidase (beta-lactamase class C family)
MELDRFVRLTLLGASLCAAFSMPVLAANGRAKSDIAMYVRQCGAALACNGSYLVAHAGQNVFQAAIGRVSADRRTRLTTDSAFDIGAINQQFVAAALLTLSAQHRLPLDAASSRYLPGSPSSLTVRQRLTDATSDEDYAQLEQIVAHASGKTYADYIHDTFFVPLGMQHARASTPTANSAPAADRAYGMRMMRNGALRPFDQEPDTDAGTTRIYATTGDLLVWANALNHGKVVDADAWREAMGNRRISQSTHWQGFANNLTVLPESGTVIVILTNNDHPEEVENARNAFLGILHRDADLALAAH